MTVWTIKGEAGKTWDATEQTFGYRAITPEAQFVFKSVGMDVFNFTVRPETLSASSTPDLGQKIIVYRGGVQFFHGTVIDVRPSYGSTDVKITVAGPWWFMDQIPMTGLQTDGEGNDEERVSYVFGTATAGQQLKTSIESLINRMIAVGVPLQLGTVATFHEYPRITLNQMSCAQAFTELLRIAPDSMSWFDYSTTPATLHVTRRAPQTAVELAVGTDPIADIQLAPRLDLQVKKVVLPYVERSATGVNKYLKQESTGTAGPGTSDPDKIQVLAMSGPELDTFLPNDEFDSVKIAFPGNILNALKKIHSNAKSFQLEMGFFPINSVASGSYSWISNWTSGGFTANYYTWSGAQVKDVKSNVLASVADIVVFGDDGTDMSPPEWATKQLGTEEGEVFGGCSYYLSAPYSGSAAEALSSFYGNEFSWRYSDGSLLFAQARKLDGTKCHLLRGSKSAYTLAGGNNRNTALDANYTSIILATSASSVDDFYVGQYISYQHGGDAWEITSNVLIASYDGATRTAYFSTTQATKPRAGKPYWFNFYTLYRDADYSFIKPPAGFAQFLKDCQDFIIYEGEVVLVQEDVGATRYSGKVINITGAFPAYTSMKAMVSGETLDVGTGTTTIELGCAERLNYRTVVDRIRKTSQDNIYYL